MGQNVAQKLIGSHLAGGEMTAGSEIGLRIDQTLTQDADARQVELVKAPSIGTLPDFDELPADLRAPVAIKVGDNISTDEILPAGARVLPFRSDVARLAEFTFGQVDKGYVERAREAGAHVIVAGENYGQGSSREHAVIAPRYLGLRLVIAKSYARIHWQNLANFGVLAAEFTDPAARPDQEHRRHGPAPALPAAGRHGAGRGADSAGPQPAVGLADQACLASSFTTAFSAWSLVARSPKSQSLPSSPSAEAMVRPSSYSSTMRGSI